MARLLQAREQLLLCILDSHDAPLSALGGCASLPARPGGVIHLGHDEKKVSARPHTGGEAPGYSATVPRGTLPRNAAVLSAAPHVVAKEGRTLTIDQAKALLDTVAGHRFDIAITLALAYGLRRGEVLGLHWAVVDWDVGTVQLTHSVKRIKDRGKASGRKARLVVGS